MIEIIYKDESGDAKDNAVTFQIPKNIRQIGLGGGKYRIYIEDYVYTFISRVAEKVKEEKGGIAILTGKAEWNEGVTYVFIKGAIYLEEPVNAEHISFENESWKTIQETGEKYFVDQDVVGWFLTIPQMPMEITELIGKTHLKYFSGGEKILMMMEPQEKEEAFFYYENGRFVKASGYYLYYEKNLKMQEYMTDHKWWESLENEKVIPDEAVKKFRKKFVKKTEGEEGKEEKSSIFSYAATACLVLAIMATGANFIRNYQQIQTSEEELEASAVFTVNDQMNITLAPAQEEVETGSQVKNDVVKNDNTETETEENEESVDVSNETEIENAEGEEGDSGAGAENTEVEDGADVIETENEKTSMTEENATGYEPEESEETSSKSVLETYMIRPGDTLYQISILNYGNMEAIEEICRMNNISEEEKIYPGQIIVLP